MTNPASVLTPVLSIPSPSSGVWHLGPLPLRGYALAIILGIIVAVAISERRWVARGGRSGEIQDIAIWAVPFGLLGGRIYHVATDHDLYFGPGRHPIDVFKVWEGGLGLWGAIGLGAVGAALGARRAGVRMSSVLDTMAPGCLIAQGLGRWGNWFNQELYGRPTDLPWGLRIDPDNYPRGREFPPGTTFHPTFLYEFTWDLLVFAVVVWADRRFKMGHGRVVALYVMGYTIGRGLIENLRIDTVELNDVGGLRFNVWTSIVLFVLAAAYFAYSLRRHPGREASVYVDGRGPTGVDPLDDSRGGASDASSDASADRTPDGADDSSSEAQPAAGVHPADSDRPTT